MKPHFLLLLALSAVCGSAAAEDGFKGIRCEADIAKALTGRHMPNEPTDVTEAHHKELRLKSLGGEELDWGNEVWWRMCGATVDLLLDKHDTVRDVLKIPTPAGTAVLEGACKGVQGELIAVVTTQPGAADLPATAAWKIDDAKKSFVAVTADGLLCSRYGLLDGVH